MADSLINIQSLTLNPTEADNVSEAIFETVITGGPLNECHEIMTGIDHKQQIPFIGNFGLVGKKVTGCDREGNPVQIPLTEKFWDPEKIGDRLKHCAADLPSLLKLFKKAQRMNPDYYDRIGTEEFGLIISKVDIAMITMLNRLVWFGDKAADNVATGGVFKNGTDVDYFNIIDGLFKQIFAEVPAGADNYVEIVENQGVSYAEQDNLPADFALKLFRSMYNSTDARFWEALAQGGEPVISVTRKVFQNYQDHLEDKSLIFTLAEAKDGVTVFSYRGIPIKVRHDWDANIRAYQDNGTKFNLPHRAILTLKENIPVGTLSEGDLNSLESWYEKKDKANYIDFDLRLDAKHLLPYMTVAAY